MWVFGYGSLIWKVDFPIETSRPGYIKGFVRRFWQGSHDHRGTEENPGRVVTLIPTEELAQFEDNHMETIAWGMAYKVEESKVAEVVKHLDHREKNGYSVHHVHVYHPDSETPVVEDAVVYIGTPDNEAFLGPASLDAISHQIAKSVGPSGPNIDYLLNLCHALRAISPDAFDSHLFALEKRVLEIKAEQAKQVEY
ncbi:ChaC, cation transport regulator 2 [Dimargaris cristalligena]|uniref:glutathione-specific gamma-glutamylcyclotransferase n=1 Tax=Dimargaris cristalligena TaxID=215637 RepID=A0A4P9ZZQ4_9FUNG|nr:ChaC, cation transport regulator 2 [Dimargaris cristalligena]|eukprot:RKP39274.1 ChaC, cation transport regulator 2 [Dimargaris cristalligena]